MKVKFSVIPFIPVAIAMIALKIMSIFGLDSNGLFMGMNIIGINYVVIGLALALFAVCVIINIFDRKTAPVYPVKKNPFAGVFAVLSGVIVAGSSAVTLLNTAPDTEYYYMTVVCAVLAALAGIALIVMSKVHFIGKSVISGISMLFIFPSVWGCAELVSEFMSATKVSISASDMTPLFCYIFITLYLFSHSMIISRIKGKNPVKACFIYGLPAVALSISYGLYEVITAVSEGAGIIRILQGAQFIVLALYALSFIIEISFGTLTKDEVEIIDGLPNEDSYENSYIKSGGYDELVFSDSAKNDSEEKASISDAPIAKELDDFILMYDSNDEEELIPYKTKDGNKNSVKAEDILIKGDFQADDIIFRQNTNENTLKTEATADTASDNVSDSNAAESEIKEEVEPVEVKDVKSSTEHMKSSDKKEEKKPESLNSESYEEAKYNKRMSEIDLLLQELDSKK